MLAQDLRLVTLHMCLRTRCFLILFAASMSHSLGFVAMPVAGVRVAKRPSLANGASARPQASIPTVQTAQKFEEGHRGHRGHIAMAFGQSVLAIALAVLPGRAGQRAARSAMRCGGGIAALAVAMGSTMAMDYAFKYLNGKSVQYLEGQMGKHAAATIKEVEELQVGDLVLTMNLNMTPQWTQVEAVVAHPGRPIIDCTAFGQDSFLNIAATLNHRVVVRCGGTLMAVGMGDLELGQRMVGSKGQCFEVVRMASHSSGCVFEVETRAGTILLNGLLAMAASTDEVGSRIPLQELLMQISEPMKDVEMLDSIS
eukprot:Skav206997  [mRNA]  locus=scaffold1299:6483:7591:- [translate_table: standard]